MALDVPLSNEGTSQLRTEHSHEEWAVEARKKAWSKARDPERCAKIAASKRGKKRPASVIEAMRQSNIGRKASNETRRKMSQAAKRLGTIPPLAVGKLWTAEDDELVRTLTATEAAKQLDRTYAAIKRRRWKLGVPDGRRRSRS